jgi:Flp pilus assembly protein TadG
MLSVRGRRVDSHRFGQTATEFALVAPVLFLVILGVLDGCLLMFSVGTARYGAVEGSRQAAQLGNAATADTQTLRIVRQRVGADNLFSVDEIDIYKLNQDGNGNLTPDLTLYNRYAADGTPLLSPEPWQPESRDVGNGTSDFLGVTVKFTYTWKTGLLQPLGPLHSTATNYIRLEPQSY